MNFYMDFVAALIPLAVGAVYYHPKVMGNMWMKASGMTEEKMKTGNMALIFGLAYVMGLLIAVSLNNMVVHQASLYSLFGTEPGFNPATPEGTAQLETLMEQVGDKYRTFGHGAFHGFFISLLFVTPIITTIALFERKGFKYIASHALYWIISITLMGGLLCATL